MKKVETGLGMQCRLRSSRSSTPKKSSAGDGKPQVARTESSGSAKCVGSMSAGPTVPGGKGRVGAGAGMAAVSGTVGSPFETGHDSSLVVILLTSHCWQALPSNNSGRL